MIQLNYRDSRPFYEQIKEKFRELILKGVLKADEKLPSVRELATQLTISPNTIGRAYRELERDGYVYSVTGRGTFVSAELSGMAKRREELLSQFDAACTELFYLDVSAEELQRRILQTASRQTSDTNAQTEGKEGI